MAALFRFTCLLALQLAFIPVTRASDEPPQPPPLRGETLTHFNQVVMRQIAPPVTMADESALLFNLDGSELVVRRIYPADERKSGIVPLRGGAIESGPRLGYSSSYPARYASTATSAGVWLIGPSVRLIRANGQVITGKLPTPRNDPTAVGLADGSVMVIGGYAWPESRDFSTTLKVERVWLEADGTLRTEVLASLPVDISGTGVWEAFSGFSALHIGGNRVMVTGTEYRHFTLLYEPATKSWAKLAPMVSPRARTALVQLPDGRVWASGAANSGPPYNLSTASELWDPKTRTWQRGPDLPVPMQDHRAVWVAEKGVVLLGAGRFPVVLSWKPGDAQVHVAAQLSIERQGGALVPLVGQKLGVVSGISARVYGEAWGRRSPGASVVSWAQSSPADRSGVWQITERGGLALHGTLLLAVGGTLTHAHQGSVDSVATRVAELTDPRSGTTTTLRPLPFDAARAEVVPLSKQRAIIHAEAQHDGYTGELAILDIGTGQYSRLDASAFGTRVMSDGTHNRVRLIGADERRAWVVGEDASVHWIDAASGQLSSGPRLQRKRSNFNGRVLNNGRVVVAGGAVEAELVASRPADCPDCPVRYVGWGNQLPSRRHELFDPASQTWLSSAPSRAAGGDAAILADGRVAKVGAMPGGVPSDSTERRGLALELSSANGSTWKTLPLPGDTRITDDEGAYRVMAPLGDGGLLQTALFLGMRNPANALWSWWWLPSVDASHLVWHELDDGVPPYQFPPGEIALCTDDPKLKDMFAVGSAAGVAIFRRPGGAKDGNCPVVEESEELKEL